MKKSLSDIQTIEDVTDAIVHILKAYEKNKYLSPNKHTQRLSPNKQPISTPASAHRPNKNQSGALPSRQSTAQKQLQIGNSPDKHVKQLQRRKDALERKVIREEQNLDLGYNRRFSPAKNNHAMHQQSFYDRSQKQLSQKHYLVEQEALKKLEHDMEKTPNHAGQLPLWKDTFHPKAYSPSTIQHTKIIESRIVPERDQYSPNEMSFGPVSTGAKAVQLSPPKKQGSKIPDTNVKTASSSRGVQRSGSPKKISNSEIYGKETMNREQLFAAMQRNKDKVYAFFTKLSTEGHHI